MPDAKYTPGPWELEGDSDNELFYVISDAGYDRIYIATNEHCDAEEALANARLIAAAPELLKACEDMKNRYAQAVTWMLDRETDSDKWPDWMSESGGSIMVAEAAIAKAKGEVHA